MPFSGQSLPLSLPQATTVFCLFLFCFLFYHRFTLPILELYVNGIIQFILFCFRILSFSIIFLSFIHAVVCISNSFLYIELYSIVWLYHRFLSIHLLLDPWVISNLEVLWILMLWPLIYKFLCGLMISFFLGKYWGTEILGIRVAAYLVL